MLLRKEREREKKKRGKVFCSTFKKEYKYDRIYANTKYFTKYCEGYVHTIRSNENNPTYIASMICLVDIIFIMHIIFITCKEETILVFYFIK